MAVGHVLEVAFAPVVLAAVPRLPPSPSSPFFVAFHLISCPAHLSSPTDLSFPLRLALLDLSFLVCLWALLMMKVPEHSTATCIPVVQQGW